jgi:short-subunit dehydrogenase
VHGVEIEVITADLIDGPQLEPVLQRLRTKPQIDILVNNAGSGLSGDFANADPTEMDKLKSYVLTLSQSLAAEVTSKGVYVQAVLPAATRTELYERAGGDISKVPDVMEVDDLVDAALVGFDRKELVTIPPVPDVAAWESFEQARGILAAGFSNSKPAARYRAFGAWR